MLLLFVCTLRFLSENERTNDVVVAVLCFTIISIDIVIDAASAVIVVE